MHNTQNIHVHNLHTLKQKKLHFPIIYVTIDFMGTSTLKSPKIVVKDYNFLHFKILQKWVHKLNDNIVNFKEILKFWNFT